MTDRTINWVFRATDKTSAAFRSVDSKIAGITKSLRTFAGFAGFASIATGVGALTRSLVELGSELNDVSEKLGVSAEGVQVLKFAAEQTGATFEQLQSALQFNTKLTGEAVRGNKKAAEAFRLLGIDAKRFADLSLDRRFAVLAEQLSKVEDPALRLDLTLKALGRGGAGLAPLLAQGGEALSKYEDQLRSTNSILSNEQVKALDEAGDAWDAFILRLKARAAPAVTETIGFLGRLGDSVAALTKQLGSGAALPGGIPRDFAPPIPKGPQRRRGTAGVLSSDEAAALVGIPGKKSLDKALADFDKAFATVDAILAKGRAESEAAAKSSAKAIQDEIDGIFTNTRTPQETYYAGLERIAELQGSGLDAETAARAVDQLAQQFAIAQQAIYDASLAGREWNDLVAESAQITEDTITPLERYWRQLDLIQKALYDGLITPEISTRATNDAAQKAADELREIAGANDQVKDSTEQLFEDLKLAANGFARDLTDVFFDSTNSIGDMFKKLAETIAKALFTSLVTEPLVASILGSFGKKELGGPVSAGRPYLVGEKGPELLVSNQAAARRVVPGAIMAGASVVGEDGPEFIRPSYSGKIIPHHDLIKSVQTATRPPVDVERLAPVILNRIVSASPPSVAGNGPEFPRPSRSGEIIANDDTQRAVARILESFKLPPFAGFRAGGGPVSPGSAYVVGERGPELFVPSSSGKVLPEIQSAAQPVQVNLTINSVDPHTAAQTIANQERLITGMIRRATMRAGRRPVMA